MPVTPVLYGNTTSVTGKENTNPSGSPLFKRCYWSTQNDICSVVTPLSGMCVCVCVCVLTGGNQVEDRECAGASVWSGL